MANTEIPTTLETVNEEEIALLDSFRALAGYDKQHFLKMIQGLAEGRTLVDPSFLPQLKPNPLGEE